MTRKIRNPHFLKKSEIRNGFSLVELIIVIAIIIILGGIGIGVGYKFLKAADIETTKANITLIMNAIDKYYDENGSYPVDPLPTYADVPTGNYMYTDFLHKDLFAVEWNNEYKPDPDDENTKFADTSIGKTSLNKLDAECVALQTVPHPGDTDRYIWAFTDAFGKPMLYLPNGALGGRPLLISAGPDGLFGPDIIYYFKKDGSYKWDEDSEDDSDADDNIRSDK